MPMEICLSEKVQQQRKRIVVLREELAALYEQREFMTSHERDELTALYTMYIGKMQFEEFSLKLAIQKLKRLSELIQAKKNRGEIVVLSEIEKQVENEYLEYQLKVEQQMNQIKAAADFLNAPTLTEEDAKELKSLYRVLVKRLHPDWNPEQTEQEKELFVRAMAAYKTGDVAELRNILLVLDKEKSIDELKDDSLEEQIKKLEESLKNIQLRIDQLNEIFPFTYRERLNDFAWIKSEQDKLNESIQQLVADKTTWEAYVASQKDMKINNLAQA